MPVSDPRPAAPAAADGWPDELVEDVATILARLLVADYLAERAMASNDDSPPKEAA
jgi:hypothetical protein